ncbi:MAG: enoyl-CoA hydratase-related protein [Actinomycetota bacterium]|jgi:enoyl-CoA hydratase/carnithine racemase|nr:enoyl-CoA hydratase [Actinomycetota bacterium]MDG1198098.1 enoyl-CoA hydratase-related protein [Actinomycetota bacterium]MDG1489053.1 enoyl-CoA hydratase-related protein [Actinomycetota bacterium]MDG2119885.1 enoyl-CoA hydratase-related protein [Actinomycetota bacterium]
MSEAVVLYEETDGVAIITLNRPERLNSWTGELGTGYFNALDAAAASAAVKSIVVTGAGRGFCSGADMDMLQGIQDRGGEGEERPKHRDERHDYALSIPKPVIAAINGACAGLGFVHAMMCDIRFAAEGAKFTSAFARRGLIAEHGVSYMLPRVVGPSNALDILMSGRVFLADEAKEMGVVSRVLAPEDLLSASVEYARDLGKYSAPWSMAQMKKQVWNQLDLARTDALAESNSLMVDSLKRKDFKEGVASFVEKRDPAFEPVTEV